MLRYSRHNVIAMVEMSPKKSCEQGWKYDHSTVFTTITSEVDKPFHPSDFKILKRT